MKEVNGDLSFFRVNSSVLFSEPGERLISTLWIWPSFWTTTTPPSRCHHHTHHPPPPSPWLTHKVGPVTQPMGVEGLGEKLELDDPFFWIKGFTQWMTSAWDQDTTRLICSGLAIGQSCCNCHCWKKKPIDWCRETGRDSTEEWMTRHVNFQRERFITLKRFVELLGKKNLRVYPSALQSSIYVTTRITVFILRAQMVIRTLTLEILFVFLFRGF